MTHYFVILSPFVFFTLVQGQQLLFQVDRVHIRSMVGPLKHITCGNLAIYLTNRSHFDLSETERTPENFVLKRRRILLFEIFEISLMPPRRLVIQAFEGNSADNLLVYLHCTISEPLNDAIFNMVQYYRMLKGIRDLPMPMYKFSKVWKYGRLGDDSSRIQVMDSSLFFIEDISNVNNSRLGRKRFTVKCVQDTAKWMIFSSDHFGVYPVKKTNQVFIVITEIAGADDEELLHYYAVEFPVPFAIHFYEIVLRDARADLNCKLANTMQPIIANSIIID